MAAPRTPNPTDPAPLREWLNVDHDGRIRVTPDHCCLPEPLAVVCRLDNALGPHDDHRSWRCWLHDWVTGAYWRLPGGG